MFDAALDVVSVFPEVQCVLWAPPSVDLRAISAIKDMVPIIRDSGLAYDCRSFRLESLCGAIFSAACLASNLAHYSRTLSRFDKALARFCIRQWHFSNFPPDGYLSADTSGERKSNLRSLAEVRLVNVTVSRKCLSVCDLPARRLLNWEFDHFGHCG